MTVEIRACRGREKINQPWSWRQGLCDAWRPHQNNQFPAMERIRHAPKRGCNSWLMSHQACIAASGLPLFLLHDQFLRKDSESPLIPPQLLQDEKRVFRTSYYLLSAPPIEICPPPGGNEPDRELAIAPDGNGSILVLGHGGSWECLSPYSENTVDIESEMRSR